MSKKQEAFWGYIVCIVVAIGLAAALASWWSSDDIGACSSNAYVCKG